DRMLLDVSRSTASHRDLPSLLRDLLGVLRGVARFDRLGLVLHDPARDVMSLHTIAAVHPALTTVIDLPPAEAPSGVAWQTQRPVVVSSIDRETRFPRVTEILVAEGMRSFCVLPLTSPLRRLGALSFASAEEDAFGEADVEFLQQLTSQVALAVDNVLHHEAAQRAQQDLGLERADLERLSADIARLLLAEGIQSMCCVPLTVHDRRLGTLNVGRLGSEPFTAEDADLLAAVANQVAFSVENALAFQEIAELKDKLAAEKVYLEDEIRTEYNFEEIIGEAPALKRLLHQVETVAPTDSAVLVCGETGTGKELIARAIHDLSRRRERTFVKLNCAAIPTGLLESELFGHKRGAFTGAIAQKIGRFELADGGTLFLDEVGDIPVELQPKLLRVLQEQEFERLGGTRTIHTNARLVAATNRDLAGMVAAREFRSDLYYRLNVFPILVPPLRERREDIPLLVRYFAQKLSRRMNKRIETIPAEAMDAMMRYRWPGNIRELE